MLINSFAEDLVMTQAYQQAYPRAVGNPDIGILVLFVRKLISLLTVNQNATWPPQ